MPAPNVTISMIRFTTNISFPVEKRGTNNFAGISEATVDAIKTIAAARSIKPATTNVALAKIFHLKLFFVLKI
jgi:hypothetical protein